MKFERIAAAVLTAALCACSGSPGGSPMPGTPLGSAPGVEAPLAASGTAVTVRLTIPKATAERPAYVSSGTKSVAIFEGKSRLGVFGTLATSKGCKAKSHGTVCTFTMAAKPGKNEVFRIKTYAAAKARGKLLASATIAQTIVAGKTNALKFTLEGIVASIAVALENAQPVTGSPASIPVYVAAMDASGATIVGAGKYVPAITLTDSDTTGATLLSTTSVTAPSTAVTLTYNGSSALTSATISATAPGISPEHVSPATLRPTTLAGVTVSGAAAFAVVSDSSGNAVAFIPVGTGLTDVTVASKGTLNSAGPKPAARAPRTSLALNPPPDECAPDLIHAQLYCMSFASNVVSIVKYDPSNVLAAPTLAGQTTTDAPSSGVSFSGAICTICGIAFDPIDDAFIISTANGYELWPRTPGASAPIKTLPAPVSENFGYNALTNQIFSPWYGTDSFDAGYAYTGIDVIDVASGNRYELNDPSLSPTEPDAGAVDTKTNLAIAPEEGSLPIYLLDLTAPPAAYTAPTPLPSPLPTGTPPYPSGTFTTPVVSATPPSSLVLNCEETYTAVDSVEDIGFFGSEFCSSDYVAAAQLPSTSGSTPAISNYVAAELPNTPAGAFQSPQDPHAILVMNLPGICADCGILFNYDKSYLAIVDLNKLLALNPGGGEYDVPTTNPLTGIVTYLATGISSPPSLFARRLAAGKRHTIHRR
jgi:hypothetical protein